LGSKRLGIVWGEEMERERRRGADLAIARADEAKVAAAPGSSGKAVDR
jgi:hypothetical protein